MQFRKQLLNEIKNALQSDGVKEEIKLLFTPIIHLLLQNIYPYIYLSLIFVIISFLLILGNFLLVLRFLYRDFRKS